MKLIKLLARIILHEEIKELKERKESLEDEILDLAIEMDRTESKLEREVKKLQKEKESLQIRYDLNEEILNGIMHYFRG